MRPEKAADKQYEEVVIESVRQPYADKGWEIHRDGGGCFYVPPTSPVVPKAGMTARFYGRGIGFIVRGLDIDGQEVFYRTEDEQNEIQRQWVAAEDKKRETEYEAKREDYERRVEALPKVFKNRILKFRAANDRFRYDFEPYELFCCEEALKISVHCKTPEGVDAFHKSPWEEQAKAGLGKDHSGNTFGAACLLAKLYLTKPEFVTKAHGALTPLVGCVEYGCEH